MADKMKVAGNLGEQRAGQVSKAFPRGLNKKGASGIGQFKYRSPKIEGGLGPKAV